MVPSSEQCSPTSYLCCGHNGLFWRPHRGLPADDAHAVRRIPPLVVTTVRKGGRSRERSSHISGYVRGRQGFLHQRWQGAADNTTKWTVSELTAGSLMVGTPIYLIYKIVWGPIRLRLIKDPICPLFICLWNCWQGLGLCTVDWLKSWPTNSELCCHSTFTSNQQSKHSYYRWTTTAKHFIFLWCFSSIFIITTTYCTRLLDLAVDK